MWRYVVKKVVNILQHRTAVQRDFTRLEKWAGRTHEVQKKQMQSLAPGEE